ncbi:MAG: aspartate/glutamate racemase family protein [Bacteroidaceae bacterium]|nr:aspartate/glutamate racemase family protein [Bacteroidaceae bacterium]
MTPIGVFDSGYGGLTVLSEIRRLMPEYDYLYLGDNARAPYGPRSFERVYEFTLQAVRRLFSMGCPLIILACNTASAKALRTIQQRDLPLLYPPKDTAALPPSEASALPASNELQATSPQPSPLPERRVLGVIRPTAEIVGTLTRSRHIGIVATQGTVSSRTYELEIAKLFPDVTVTAQACPMWVPLVENHEAEGPGADYFVKRDIDRLMATDPLIDTIILGCTHFPLLINKVRAYAPAHVQLISQGEYVARSLQDYLHRHTDIDSRLSRGASAHFLTTEDASLFSPAATLFLGHPVEAKQVTL